MLAKYITATCYLNCFVVCKFFCHVQRHFLFKHSKIVNNDLQLQFWLSTGYDFQRYLSHNLFGDDSAYLQISPGKYLCDVTSICLVGCDIVGYYCSSVTSSCMLAVLRHNSGNVFHYSIEQIQHLSNRSIFIFPS